MTEPKNTEETTEQEQPVTEEVEATETETATEANTEASTEAAAESSETPKEANKKEEPTADDTIAALQAELQATKEQMLRQHAELENFKKRKTAEAQERLKFASQSLIMELLPGLDNLERAIDHADLEDEKLKSFVEGIEMVKQHFFNALKKHKVERTFPLGELFDPNHHEAVGTVSMEEIENDHVAVVLQPGYNMYDRAIRPAMVQVCKK